MSNSAPLRLAGMAVAVVVILLITPVGPAVLAGDVLLAGGQPKLLHLRADPLHFAIERSSEV